MHTYVPVKLDSLLFTQFPYSPLPVYLYIIIYFEQCSTFITNHAQPLTEYSPFTVPYEILFNTPNWLLPLHSLRCHSSVAILLEANITQNNMSNICVHVLFFHCNVNSLKSRMIFNSKLHT